MTADICLSGGHYNFQLYKIRGILNVVQRLVISGSQGD